MHLRTLRSRLFDILSSPFGSKAIFRQILAGTCASFAIMSLSSSFVWLTPQIERLKSNQSDFHLTPDQTSWAISITELGNLLMAIPSGMVLNTVGRKRMLLGTGPMFILSWILILFTRSFIMLLLARLLQGLALGMLYTALPMFLAEIASTKVRGGIGFFFLGGYYAGTLYEYCIGPYVSYQTSILVTLFPPIAFVVTFVWFPESPYQYLLWNNVEEAGKSLAWYRCQSHEEVSDELEAMRLSVEDDMRNKGSWGDLFRTYETRKAIKIVLLIGLTYTLCGGTTIFAYATDSFGRAGEGMFSPAVSTIILGVIVFATVTVTARSVDTMGRRPILLISCIGSSITLLCAATYYLLLSLGVDVSSIQSWFPIVALVSFADFIGAGVEAVYPGMQAELFPSNLRGLGGSFSRAFVIMGSFFCLKIHQVISDEIGVYFAYYLYACVTMTGGTLIYFYVPETKGKTFAEIQAMLRKS